MLTITGQPRSGRARRDHPAPSRRRFLQLGTLGSMGLSLPTFLQAARETRSSTAEPGFGRAKRCIFVFLNGGPSQLDMWDMKPDAPAEVRGELTPIATNVPGVFIGELLPLLSRQAEKFKIVRSVSHTCTVHTTGVYTMLTGTLHQTPTVDQTESRPDDHPHVGSIFSHWRGWRDGRPPFVTLPKLFEAPPVTGIWPGQSAGFLGRQHDPFVIRGDKQTATFSLPAIEWLPELNVDRFEHRRRLLNRLDDSFRSAEPQLDNVDTFYGQAFSLLQSKGVQQAIDVSRESQNIRDRYGQHLFGQGLLLARRLVEAGLPLVTIYWIDPTPAGAGGGEYDSHGRIYHHMRNRLVPPTDRALSALFADLSDRGLLDDTLVVVLGEFGRTPRLNKDAGRDHWPWAQSILLAGAGITGGTVFGATDRFAAYPTTRPVSPPDLTQTILHLLGVPSDLVLHDRQGRPIKACHGTPVAGLYS